ncbi:MAG: glycosyltransferase [Candidatus Omnitrophota bacterium]
MEGAKVSVIVPAKGLADYLEKCITSLIDLDYPNFEIIVVDDGLSIRAKNILTNYGAKIRILDSGLKGPSYCRNMAVKESDAEYIAFTDSDCILDKFWLKELIRGFQLYPDAVGVGGTQGLPKDASKFEERVFLFMKKSGFITDYMRKTKSNIIKEVKHNASCNVMYKREIFLKEQGFLEGLWPGEDVELDYRLRKKGYKLFFNPKALIFHHRPKDLNSFLKMMYRYGWAQGFLVRRYGFFRSIQILPFLSLLIIGLMAFSIISNFFVALILALTLLLFCYFKANIFLLTLALLAFAFWNLGFLKGLLKT